MHQISFKTEFEIGLRAGEEFEQHQDLENTAGIFC